MAGFETLLAVPGLRKDPLGYLAGEQAEAGVARMPTENRQFVDNYTERSLGTKGRVEEALGKAVKGAQNTFAPDMNMSAALSNRYRQSLAQGLKGVETANLTKPYQASANALAGAGQVQAHRRQIELQNLQRLEQAQVAHERARAMVLGSLLGLGGAGAGYAVSRNNSQPAAAPAAVSNQGSVDWSANTSGSNYSGVA